MFEIISHLITLLVGTLMYGASVVVGGVEFILFGEFNMEIEILNL